MQFRSDGRLGCPSDYDTFRVGLEPILLRIHRATRHVGKVPRRAHPAAQLGLLELRQQLWQAVEREEYERAALLRDQIRFKEASHESGPPDPIDG
jgi:protein arginine kinase activator